MPALTTPVDRRIAETRTLLACGVVAGPLFVAGSLVQAFTREGYDLGRHPISLLSLGDLGWLQVTNFVVTGALYVACAVGLRRALQSGPGGTWGPRLVGALGSASSAPASSSPMPEPVIHPGHLLGHLPRSAGTAYCTRPASWSPFSA
jgi:hypothetical protein